MFTSDRPRHRSPRGFTLIELMIVITIIGILMALILTAAMEGIHAAEARATQSLITKLELAMSDRLDALVVTRAPVYPAHTMMAGVYNPAGSMLFANTPNSGAQRSQVIATYDFLKSEVPDVFYIPKAGDPDANPSYPLNFAMHAFPTNTGAVSFILPLGAGSTMPSTGNNGASYTAAGGIYKNAGYPAQATDGADSNGNGLIDDIAESSGLSANMGRHLHKTARSEVLYAILVEGRGSLGSSFSADDFTSKEVMDTDGDGLPEFVDAWGEPLQFYRWPIFYTSDVEKGAAVYNGVFETRQQDPLDPNQHLVNPAWWSSNNQGPGAPFSSTGNVSGCAVAFMRYFHSLLDPNYFASPAPPHGALWDRGFASGTPDFTQRRAHYSKFLIASSGQDKELGIVQLPDSALSVDNLMKESCAVPFPIAIPTPPAPNPNPVPPFTNTNPQAGEDDITNHNIHITGGVIQ